MDDGINSFDNTKIAGRISSSLYDLYNCQFTASTYLSPFLFYEEQGQRRKEKSEGATSPLSPLGLAEAPLRRRPRGRLSLPPPPPVRGAFTGDQNPNPALRQRSLIARWLAIVRECIVGSIRNVFCICLGKWQALKPSPSVGIWQILSYISQ